MIGFVGYGTFIPYSSCACLRPEDLLLSQAREIERFANDYNELHGFFPSSEFMITRSLENQYYIDDISPWDDNPSKYGLYYKSVNGGHGYVLAVYVDLETLFGRTVLSEVYSVSK